MRRALCVVRFGWHIMCGVFLHQGFVRNTQYARRSTNTAFTLVEVMVTTAVLSLGAVLIYEAFFTSLNAFDYCSDYLNIAPWVDEKIWQVEDYLRCFGSSDKIATTGTLTSKSKRFDWVLSCNLIDGNSVQDLYKINLVLFWQQGERKKELARTTYALYEKKEE